MNNDILCYISDYFITKHDPYKYSASIEIFFLMLLSKRHYFTIKQFLKNRHSTILFSSFTKYSAINEYHDVLIWLKKHKMLIYTQNIYDELIYSGKQIIKTLKILSNKSFRMPSEHDIVIYSTLDVFKLYYEQHKNLSIPLFDETIHKMLYIVKDIITSVDILLYDSYFTHINIFLLFESNESAFEYFKNADNLIKERLIIRALYYDNENFIDILHKHNYDIITENNYHLAGKLTSNYLIINHLYQNPKQLQCFSLMSGNTSLLHLCNNIPIEKACYIWNVEMLEWATHNNHQLVFNILKYNDNNIIDILFWLKNNNKAIKADCIMTLTIDVLKWYKKNLSIDICQLPLSRVYDIRVFDWLHDNCYEFNKCTIDNIVTSALDKKYYHVLRWLIDKGYEI